MQLTTQEPELIAQVIKITKQFLTTGKYPEIRIIHCGIVDEQSLATYLVRHYLNGCQLVFKHREIKDTELISQVIQKTKEYLITGELDNSLSSQLVRHCLS